MKTVFLGRPLYWLLWVVIVGALYLLGTLRLHTRDFNLFILIVLALAAASVLIVVWTYRKGERITREPFEDD
ncbi:MAG: hypothetical protein OEU09_16940 [Rhodospirillales bacterium]|nr:hypothetical protein [Rhodospirillales bacterium]MDH3917611.1 hypothetical protein [Rhodospirillales bacterium]MDH3969935.1 hypothetical protein [Rhodospirillales bacterium]